jgi:hypothetical protein
VVNEKLGCWAMEALCEHIILTSVKLIKEHQKPHNEPLEHHKVVTRQTWSDNQAYRPMQSKVTQKIKGPTTF